MLIDQMKEHPEEFRGFAGKFAGTLELAQEVQRGATRSMSKRDAAAIVEAAQTHLFEVWLAEDVLTKMMQPKQELDKVAWGTTTGRNPGKSFFGPIYEERLQQEMERDRHKIEESKRRDLEHAMRNTKLFKSFI